jgi:hypothetical protein
MSSVAMNRRIRGDILRLVRKWGAKGLSFDGLQAVFFRSGIMMSTNVDLGEHVSYLEGKGYLRTGKQRDQFESVERWMIQLTPTGIDLLDQTIDPDPGVEIVC